ncbi:penicillin-insensitive murein endopeptidase, partial [Azospirillum aestuarii]|uniref:penicillin-insensitive murein endopeptidase n=1 Tax=Azospirillum aestuarii TaxID=2802052 RepID=UPI0040551452
MAFVQDLARRAQAERLGWLAIGDISKVNGGRMESGHASHQIGLDVDVWFDLDQPPLAREARERTDFPTMVNRQAQRVLPERFGPRQARLLGRVPRRGVGAGALIWSRQVWPGQSR